MLIVSVAAHNIMRSLKSETKPLADRLFLPCRSLTFPFMFLPFYLFIFGFPPCTTAARSATCQRSLLRCCRNQLLFVTVKAKYQPKAS